MKENEFTMLALPRDIDDQAIYEQHPEPVLCKLDYAAPYEEFAGIRAIHLAVREHDVFERSGVVLALDLSDYLEHESEEYFVTTLKFLSDMSERWNYVFILKGGSPDSIRRMFAAARCYMNGTLVTSAVRRDSDFLRKQLRSCLFDSAAAECLAEALLADEFSSCRSKVFFSGIASEILACTGGETVSVDDLMDYVCKEGNTLAVIGGQNVVDAVCAFRHGKECNNV